MTGFEPNPDAASESESRMRQSSLFWVGGGGLYLKVSRQPRELQVLPKSFPPKRPAGEGAIGRVDLKANRNFGMLDVGASRSAF